MGNWVLGIDPGKSTGMALYDPATKKVIHLWTADFWSAYMYCIMEQNIEYVVIEVPTTKHVWQGDKGTKGSLQHTAVNVGSVLREAELLADGIEKLNKFKVVRVNPFGKKNQKDFKRITGWDKRTNQHERDAAMMCYKWRKG